MHVCRICDDFHAPDTMKADLSTHITPLTIALSKSLRQTIITRNSEIGSLGDIPIYTITPERPFSLIRSGITVYKKMKQLNEDFGLVHFHNPAFSSIVSKKSELPPVVMTLHDSPLDIKSNVCFNEFRNLKEGLYYYYMSKYAATRVDALVCVSQSVADSLIKQWHLDEDKVFTINTAVDVSLFYPKNIKRDIDLLFVGRFVNKKRPADFVRVAACLKDTYPDLKAYMIGFGCEDSRYSEVIRLVKSNNLSKNVVILPAINQRELSSFYSRSKVLLITSVSESSPKVMLEAMACGTPVVASDILGSRDMLIDRKTGFLVPVKNTKSMVEKIKILFDDEGLRNEIGTYTSKYIFKNYTWERVSKLYLRIYRSLL